MIAILQLLAIPSVLDHVEWTKVIVTSALLGNGYFFSAVQFQEMLKGFKGCISKDDSLLSDALKMCGHQKICLSFHPQPVTLNCEMLEVIILWFFREYLQRPGHMLLPGDMIPSEEFKKEHGNSLLWVQKKVVVILAWIQNPGLQENQAGKHSFNKPILT